MSATYNNLAYEKAIFEYLRKHLEDKFTPGGGGQKEVMLCEEVPYAHREVPLEAIGSAILRLESEVRDIDHELQKFSFKREDVRPIARPGSYGDGKQGQQGSHGHGHSQGRGRRAQKQGQDARRGQ